MVLMTIGNTVMEHDETHDLLAKAIREVPVSEVGRDRITRYGTDYQRALLAFYQEVKRLIDEGQV